MANNVEKEEKIGLMYKIGAFFTFLARQFIPDALIFALALTFVVYACAVIFTDSSVFQVLMYQGGGMWNLLAYSMQVVGTLFFSGIFANTKIISAAIKKLCDIPKTPTQAYIFGFWIGCIAMLISWALGLVVGGLYCKGIVKSGKIKGVDYPFLVSTLYATLAIWHGGLSGTIPLVISIPNSIASEYLVQGLVPQSEFFFHFANVALILLMFFTTPFVIIKPAQPPKSKIIELDASFFADEVVAKEYVRSEKPTVAEWLETSHIVIALLGILLLAYNGYGFATKGIAFLELNSLNATLFGLGCIFSKNTLDFIDNGRASARSCGPLMCQFPIYAGIMAMVTKSGLDKIITALIVKVATPASMPSVINISSAILNMIIPSGGGKFSVEAPVYIPAVYEVGSEMAACMIGSAWGDAVTNLIQPFWALPLLSIARLGIRDVMGYCVLYCAYIWILIHVVLNVYTHIINPL